MMKHYVEMVSKVTHKDDTVDQRCPKPFFSLIDKVVLMISRCLSEMAAADADCTDCDHFVRSWQKMFDMVSTIMARKTVEPRTDSEWKRLENTLTVQKGRLKVPELLKEMFELMDAGAAVAWSRDEIDKMKKPALVNLLVDTTLSERRKHEMAELKQLDESVLAALIVSPSVFDRCWSSNFVF